MQRHYDSTNAAALLTADRSRNLQISKVVPASQLPDYAPAYVRVAPYTDLDGRIWIQSRDYPQPAGGTVYDVVDAKGQLVDRVQLPGGCTLAGVGRGVAYITSREGLGTVLARVRIR